MILMNNLQENEELKTASKNLPNECFIEFYIDYASKIHSANHLWLFPYSNTQHTYEEDIGNYFSNTEFSQFVKRDKTYLKWETQFINLNYVSAYYNFIDLYVIGYADEKIKTVMQFSEKDGSKRKVLFSYVKMHVMNSYSGGTKKNIFLGTIGRVSDGWKFYPKLEPCGLDREKIVKKYTEEICIS